MRIARQSVSRFLLAVAVVGLSLTSVVAADWPWIYGPRRTTPPNRRDSADMAAGGRRCSGRSRGRRFRRARRAGQRLLLDRDEKVGDTLRVLDLASGKELWTFAYDAPGSFMFAGSRTTPTVDGELVYTVGPMGDLHAISTKTRKPAWRKNIWKDFGGGAGCRSGRSCRTR